MSEPVPPWPLPPEKALYHYATGLADDWLTTGAPFRLRDLIHMAVLHASCHGWEFKVGQIADIAARAWNDAVARTEE